MVKIKQTEDKELLEEILKQLKENDGYCPCSIVQNKDTKCACKAFRDMINTQTPGECLCGRFIIEVTEG